MNKRTSRIRFLGVLLGVAGIFLCGMGFEYVEGKSLKDTVESGPLNID